MNLSEHFTLEEALFSSTAQRLGIENQPPMEVYPALKATATGMEQVRALLGHPIHVDSWYRCPKLNKAVGGDQTSRHMFGWAVDFVCPAFGTPKQIVKAVVESKLAFDKIIMEGSWVHLSFAPPLRRLAMVATFKDGKATYTEGLA